MGASPGQTSTSIAFSGALSQADTIHFQSHVAPYAHVEYDRGYIVFTRWGNDREVLRRTIDAAGDPHSGVSPPEKKMLDVSAQAAARFDSAASRRGHFKAWALLRLPESCRWLRLSYPNLLTVATSNAYVWDITRSQFVVVIRDVQRRLRGFQLGATSYAEVNDTYVFICAEGGLRIFAREGGALLYQLPSRELSGTTWDVRPSQTRNLASSIVHPQILGYNKHSSSSSHGSFMACMSLFASGHAERITDDVSLSGHVSASGKDLAVLTTNGRLLLLPGFQRLFAKPKAVLHRDIAIILNFQQHPNDDYTSCYLAVGSRNGKLSVATVCVQNDIHDLVPKPTCFPLFHSRTASTPSLPMWTFHT